MPRTSEESKKSFINKEERQKCWDARDLHWQCIDEKGRENDLCDKTKSGFDEVCPKAWVKHFDRRKIYLEYKKKLESGYDPIDANYKG